MCFSLLHIEHYSPVKLCKNVTFLLFTFTALGCAIKNELHLINFMHSLSDLLKKSIVHQVLT